MVNKNENKNQKKQLNPYIRFTSVAFQMGATIYLGNLIGKWLDNKYDRDFWESIITLLAVFLAIYQVISQVIKISKNND
ncbi:AtpZ/AtpI family protein [Tamlana sp. 2201CG12-4]|uniref:AtpZ/AtpI family protein n=1 Tax=Tamlana sp. 2201CG12-4 TaxID=3112582 RepID=UPI002DB8E35F|nr:AtpZ/AtpI family protein [Tamlana sp. 2201CG12-4]MEC3906331.1 AtpZ/AtpI family protein [Tamlana sp. 2201CG12-4]